MDELRFDFVRLGRNVTRTPQGFLRIPAYFSRTGIQIYERADGTKIREYRPESEVFAEDSLATFAAAPVTDGHPPAMITPNNVKNLAIGWLEGGVRRDGNRVSGHVIIADVDAIAKAERGDLRECSMGYRCKPEPTPGESPEGEKYDAIQRSIVINHAALGPAGWGRAGSDVCLRLDSSAASSRTRLDRIEKRGSQWAVLSKSGRVLGKHKTREEAIAQLGAVEASKTRRKKRKDSMRKVKINGMTFDVEDNVAEALDVEQARRDSASEDREKLQARCDAAEEKNKKLEADLAKAQDPKELEKRIEERADLIAKARSVLGSDAEIPAGKRELMEAVLKKDSKDRDFTGKSDAYVEVRFDLLFEDLKKRTDADDSKQRARGAAYVAQRTPSSEVRKDQAAYQKMIEHNRQMATGDLAVKNIYASKA
jgi:hypothetical protein